jgi:chromosome segregation ATPase
MTEETAPCGCTTHRGLVHLCSYPALKRENDDLHALLEELNKKVDFLQANISTVIDSIPGAVRVREGSLAEDLAASLATSVAKLKDRAKDWKHLYEVEEVLRKQTHDLFESSKAAAMEVLYLIPAELKEQLKMTTDVEAMEDVYTALKTNVASLVNNRSELISVCAEFERSALDYSAQLQAASSELESRRKLTADLRDELEATKASLHMYARTCAHALGAEGAWTAEDAARVVRERRALGETLKGIAALCDERVKVDP